jgi:hypothetical protein
MADHAEFVEMAREMLAEDGRQVTFYQLDKTPADPDKPWKGPGAPTPINPVDAFIIALPVSSLRQFGFTVKDEDLFKQAEMVLMVAPPETGEQLETYHFFDDSDNQAYRISVTEVLKPGPTVVLYAMGAAR